MTNTGEDLSMGGRENLGFARGESQGVEGHKSWGRSGNGPGKRKEGGPEGLRGKLGI